MTGSGAHTGERCATARGSGADVCRAVGGDGGREGWREGLGACAAAMSAKPAAAAAKARVLNGFSVRDRRCVSGGAGSLAVIPQARQSWSRECTSTFDVRIMTLVTRGLELCSMPGASPAAMSGSPTHFANVDH